MTSLPTGTGAPWFALDGAAVPFLALFAFVWVVSGVYAWTTVPASERKRLFAFYLPSAAGGIAVALAADALSFYLCFVMMAVPAWGLITHAPSAGSRRAGAVYLTITAIGEALLLAALVLMASSSGSLTLDAMRSGIAASPHATVIVTLLLGSIGLKIGVLPVSGVLPLSYTFTPAGAAAALAGASVKVGALAMIRLLPSGTVPAEWSAAVMTLGLATAFGAALLGVLTTTPRAVLGYSSASQMGLILVAAGVGLSGPEVTLLAHGAIIAFALHHGLAKSALVLGADIVARARGRARTAASVLLTLPALALVGAPLTSGFVAKYALKDAVHALHGVVPDAVYALLPFAAIGTAALMIRFLGLVRAAPAEGSGPPGVASAAWGALLVASTLAVWVWPAEWNRHAIDGLLSADAWWTALWPGLVALGLWQASRLAPGVTRRLNGVIGPGDVLLVLAGAMRRFDTTLRGDVRAARAAAPPARRAASVMGSIERWMVAWPAASIAFVLLALVLVALSAR